MAWIEQISVEAAGGLLKKLYDDALTKAGRVWNIRRVMSQNPQVLRDSMQLYGTIMMGESPLSRVQRETLATVVSVELGCHY